MTAPRQCESGEILSQLDRTASTGTFPAFDNGYVYFGTARLSAYLADTRWAILIEVVGFNAYGVDFEGFDTTIYGFGNVLADTPGIQRILQVVAPAPGPSPFKEDSFDLTTEEPEVLQRGRAVRLDLRRPPPRFWFRKPRPLEAYDLMRGLVVADRLGMLATEAELTASLAAPLPLFARFDEWHHPDISNEERPSQNRFFVSLADALASADSSRIDLSEAGNINWQDWPLGGTL